MPSAGQDLERRVDASDAAASWGQDAKWQALIALLLTTAGNLEEEYANNVSMTGDNVSAPHRHRLYQQQHQRLSNTSFACALIAWKHGENLLRVFLLCETFHVDK